MGYSKQIKKKLGSTFALTSPREKMKIAVLCLVVALVVVIKAAPMEEVEEIKIETRADAEAFLRRHLDTMAMETRFERLKPCPDCCYLKAGLGKFLCCSTFGSTCKEG